MRYFQRLKDVREDNELNQKQIADVLEINQTQYSRYELGKNMMGIDKYIRLARFYDISLDYLAGIIDTPRDLFGTSNDFQKLTSKQKKLLAAYSENKELQAAIDKLLDM